MRELVSSEQHVGVSVQLPERITPPNKYKYTKKGGLGFRVYAAKIKFKKKKKKKKRNERNFDEEKGKRYMRRMLPIVWSSLSMVKDAALMIFVSLSYDTLNNHNMIIIIIIIQIWN